MDLVVVGAGFYGLTIAERAAAEGYAVRLIDSRSHIGGNAWSYFDERTGIEVHKYGSHLFHTSNQRVWDYVSQFTEFNNYKHRVFTVHKGQVYSLPVNLHSISQLAGRFIAPNEAADYLLLEPNSGSKSKNFEEEGIKRVGRKVFNAFFKGYTEKQWQTDVRELPPEIISRLPVRLNFDSSYFNDTWEGLPLQGYETWQTNMVQNPLISVELGKDYFSQDDLLSLSVPTVFSGPIDRFFGFKHGPLGWRTLDFEFEVRDEDDFQGTSVINYADAEPSYTRIHEFKHLHPERKGIKGTVIAREYSRFAGPSDEPYYPINTPEDRRKLSLYRREAEAQPNLHFGGRLGTYQYLDMHMAIASALTHWEEKVKPMLLGAEN